MKKKLVLLLIFGIILIIVNIFMWNNILHRNQQSLQNQEIYISPSSIDTPEGIMQNDSNNLFSTCTKDNQCQLNETCENGSCIFLNCPNCNEPREHTCTNFSCCTDKDCDDNNPYTTDKCYKLESGNNLLDASCENIQNTSKQDIITNYFNRCWEFDCNSEQPLKKLSSMNIPPSVKHIAGLIEATNTVKVKVIFVYTEDPLPQNKMDLLLDESNSQSIAYVKNWFENQAKNYEANLNLDLSFDIEQHKIPEEYVNTNDNMVNGMDTTSTKLMDYLLENFPEYKDYPVRAIFYYSSKHLGLVPPHTIGSNSFILYSTNISTPSMEAYYPSFETQAEEFAHELSHLFGASDKYTVNSNTPCIFDYTDIGYDITCHRVSIQHLYEQFGNSCIAPCMVTIWGGKQYVYQGPEDRSCPNPPIEYLKITDVTAKEMGWWDADGDGILEVNDPCPFNKENNC